MLKRDECLEENHLAGSARATRDCARAIESPRRVSSERLRSRGGTSARNLHQRRCFVCFFLSVVGRVGSVAISTAVKIDYFFFNCVFSAHAPRAPSYASPGLDPAQVPTMAPSSSTRVRVASNLRFASISFDARANTLAVTIHCASRRREGTGQRDASRPCSRVGAHARREARSRREAGETRGARNAGGRTRLTSSALDSTDGSGSRSRSRALARLPASRARARVPRREIPRTRKLRSWHTQTIVCAPVTRDEFGSNSTSRQRTARRAFRARAPR